MSRRNSIHPSAAKGSVLRLEPSATCVRVHLEGDTLPFYSVYIGERLVCTGSSALRAWRNALKSIKPRS